MAAANNVRGRYDGLLPGEWGSLLSRPRALDTESDEAVAAATLARDLGFKNYILIFRYVLPVAGPVQFALSNWDMKWYERYWSRDYIRLDPVVAQMLRAFTPFDWQDVGPLSPKQREFFKDAVKHGMADGIGGCIRCGTDQGVFFSVSSDHPLDKETKTRGMEKFMLFTSRLYESMRQEMLAYYNVSPVVLTARQRDALMLTMRGVSRAEASRVMRVSKSGFARHQEAARRKLGEASNANAVRKAIAMDLIRTFERVRDPEEVD